MKPLTKHRASRKTGTSEEPGVIPKAVHDVFAYIEEEVNRTNLVSVTLKTMQLIRVVGNRPRILAPSVLYGDIQWKDQRPAQLQTFSYWVIDPHGKWTGNDNNCQDAVDRLCP